MVTFGKYSAEYVKDPFGILSGKRYEFLIYLDISEEDEMYSEQGVQVRALVKSDETGITVLSYDLIESGTGRILDFDLEEDEEAALEVFCREHLPQGE